MRPIAIVQHEQAQGPGFLQQCLHEQGYATELFNLAEGQDLPLRAHDYAGIALLGSNRSVYEPLPWIAAELALLRRALAAEIPVLGHCFGAQLLASAMGARVTRHACPNIGWSKLWVTPAARAMFEGREQVQVFNWHYDSFEIPRGATRTMFGAHCLNKGFRHGPHLGFQGHLEVTEASVRAWCAESHDELSQVASTACPAVQSEAQILQDLPARVARLHEVARSVYWTWAQEIERPYRLHCHGGR